RAEQGRLADDVDEVVVAHPGEDAEPPAQGREEVVGLAGGPPALVDDVVEGVVLERGQGAADPLFIDVGHPLLDAEPLGGRGVAGGGAEDQDLHDRWCSARIRAMRTAASPSHSSGTTREFLGCSKAARAAATRSGARAGTSWLVPCSMVTGRSVLGRTVRQG